MRNHFFNRWVCRRTLFSLLLCAAVLFAAACGGSGTPGDPSASLQENESQVLPGASDSPSATGLPESSPSVFRGFPGTRAQRFIMAYAGEENLNLNPFASGTRGFPVDPSGFYQPIYETLFRFDPAKADYAGVLAESYSAAPDKITIKLADGRVWHDKYAFTGEDVRFTVNVHLLLKTLQGSWLSRCLKEIRMTGPLELECLLLSDDPDAGQRLLDVFTRLLILPQHTWKPVIGDQMTLDTARALRAVPVNGTGIWQYVSEDAYSVILSLAREVKVQNGSPQWVVFPKYAKAALASKALCSRETDAVLEGQALTDVLDLPPLSSPGVDVPLLGRILSGERIAGVAVNPKAPRAFRSRAFRKLLCLMGRANNKNTVYFSQDGVFSSACVLALPSETALFSHAALETRTPAYSEENVARLMEEASVTREEQSGQLLFRNAPLDPILLTYPSNSLPVLGLCKRYASVCATHGIQISLNPVSEAAWLESLEKGDYELIFMVSALNETPFEAVSRLLTIPGLNPDGTSVDPELETVSLSSYVQSFRAASNGDDLRNVLEDLTLWVLNEGVFFPFDAGAVESGVCSTAVHQSFPWDSVFAAGVQWGDKVDDP